MDNHRFAEMNLKDGLQLLDDLCHALEAVPHDLGALKELETCILLLKGHPESDLAKLGYLSDKISKGLRSSHIAYFAVPIRRLKARLAFGNLVTEGDLDRPKGVKIPLYFVLENIRSAHNVGAFFRIADCIGASEVILCGYTATPENNKIQKTSMGTESYVPWQSFHTTSEGLGYLRTKGAWITGIETARDSIAIEDVLVRSAHGLVFGNENYGLDFDTLVACDELAHLPTFGNKNSLNVSVSAGIAGYHISQKWRIQHT